MPKLQVSKIELANRYTRGAIIKGMELENFNNENLAKILACDKSTVIRKKKNPEKFDIADLRILCRSLKLSDEDIISMIRI